MVIILKTIDEIGITHSRTRI